MNKRIQYILLILGLVFVFFNFGVAVKASQPTEPDIIQVRTKDLDFKYQITILSKNDERPDLYPWEDNPELEDNHPIVLYQDDEGYKYMGHRVITSTGNSISGHSFTPEYFKIIIVTEDNQVYVTKELKRYEYDQKYLLDFTNADPISGEVNIITDVSRDHSYFIETLILILRILVVVGIKLLIAMLFSLKTKKEYISILVISLITQAILNALLNYIPRAAGGSGLGIFVYGTALIILGLILGVIETIIYGFKFENAYKGIGYGILITIISIAAMFLLLPIFPIFN